ncbi:LCP family protein [Cellulomonas carbonis]|uniref:Transcriptional regulator n=1 Tax=Cellulomonas carbonis T26 TaxID=947969 RepID=A0A0A0BSM3_9CELL|nr:LCP family protein [Cellulomonas carbonis]KGM11443.1 transcriptional regulator [Cellulomonas carbonis T26]
MSEHGQGRADDLLAGVGTDGRRDGSDISGTLRRVRGRSSGRGRRVLVVVAIVVALLGVGGVAAVQVLQSRLDSNVERLGDPFAGLEGRPTPEVAEAEPSEGPMNILVLGSDSRISAGDPSQWEAGAQRTDAIMLVHLPADHDGAYVMSIPRDSWVDIPGHGQAKINAAFSYGGPSLMIQTVEQLTGVRIDHVAVTDFESFERITDVLGGVRMTLAEDLVHNGEVLVPAGEQRLLTGEQALTYVRQRKNLARGDFDRVQRQQAWVRAIFARMRNEQTLQNPAESYPFLDAVTQSVALDDGFTTAVRNDVLARVRDLGSTDIGFFTVPIQGTGTSDDGQSIVVLAQPAFDELMAAVAADTVDEYLAANPDVVDTLPAVAP